MKQKSEMEIFVRGCQLAQVTDWLRSIVGTIEAISENEISTYIYFPLGRCVVTPKYRNGPFSCINLELHSNPWRDSFECAKQASSDLGCTVRCLKGKHLPQYSMIDGTPMYVEFDGGLSGSNEPSSVLPWRNGPYISLLDRFLNFRSSLVLLMDNMEMAGTGFGHDDFEGVVESIFDATFASYISDEYGLPMYGSSYENFVDGHGIVLTYSTDKHCTDGSTNTFSQRSNGINEGEMPTIVFHCFWNPDVESESRLNLDVVAGYRVCEPEDLSVPVGSDASRELVFVPIESIVGCDIWTTDYRF